MPWKFFKRKPRAEPDVPLAIERLESRTLLDASASLAGGVLTILGTPQNDRIQVSLDAAHGQLIAIDNGRTLGRFANNAVSQIAINTGNGNDLARIDNNVLQTAEIRGGIGNDIFYGGGGPTLLIGGTGNNKLVAGSGPTVLEGGHGSNHLFGHGSGNNLFIGGAGPNLFYNVQGSDQINGVHAGDRVVKNDPLPIPPSPDDTVALNTSEVNQLLERAAAASASNDAIIAIVDREGNILGVRVEGGVEPAITGNSVALTFAIDGALAEARTGAFFANDQAPITSRTLQTLSQSTITQREVDSNPDVPNNPNSTLFGPGLVAAIGVGGHFPPGIQNTPMADLFEIELSNRDVIGANGAVDRFNLPLADVPPGAQLPPPVSYGVASGLDPSAKPRGIGTLPGGIPIYKDGVVVGGIGVFFPGKTGFASEENSSAGSNYDPSKPDRSLEAEYIAFAALGGSAGAGASIGTLGGIAPVAGIGLPFGRIDLVGITLPIYGPGGRMGVDVLLKVGPTYGAGNPNSGFNAPVTTGGIALRAGTPVPDGYLATSHDGSEAGTHLTASDVNQIINQAVAEANQVRSSIRLPVGSPSHMTIAVSDTQGNILGLYRMSDGTVFSIDIAVAKSRNVAYYANPAQLQPIDQVPGIPPGVAFTNRTFRYLADPRYPEGIDGTPPGPFSILNDGGVDPLTGLNVGPPLPASAFNSVLGYDAFHAGANFHDPFSPANQNGTVFFPGSVPLYKNGVLVGGLGISGDGVSQDDVVTFFASQGFQPPSYLQVDNFAFNEVRLPYMNFDRNPQN